MSLYVLPLSPNDHPTTAQGSPPLGLSEVTQNLPFFTHMARKRLSAQWWGPPIGGRFGEKGDSTQSPVIG